MGYASDDWWARINTLGGGEAGFPEWSRVEIDVLLEEYHEDPMRDFEVRDVRTERAIEGALASAGELRKRTDFLVSNKNYLSYNHGGQTVDARPLEAMLTLLSATVEMLTRDKVRFTKRNVSNRERMRDIRVVRALLEIQQRARGTALPVEPDETPKSVRFVEYIRVCTRMDDHELRPVLKMVTTEFARRRKGRRARRA